MDGRCLGKMQRWTDKQGLDERAGEAASTSEWVKSEANWVQSSHRMHCSLAVRCCDKDSFSGSRLRSRTIDKQVKLYIYPFKQTVSKLQYYKNNFLNKLYVSCAIHIKLTQMIKLIMIIVHTENKYSSFKNTPAIQMFLSKGAWLNFKACYI